MKLAGAVFARDDDKILQPLLFERLKELQPIGDHSIFEHEEISKLRPRVAAFEQQEAQKIMRAYQAGPRTKRTMADALIKLGELAAKPLQRHFQAPYASSKTVSFNPADEVRTEILDIITYGLNTLNAAPAKRSKFFLPIITDRPPSSTENTLRYKNRWWLVSPMDSIDHPDTSISIAMIDKGKPLAGIVHLPKMGRTYAGAIGEEGFAIVKTPRRTREIKVKLSQYFRRVAGTARHTGKSQVFASVRRSHHITRLFGELSAPYALCRLAQGSMDIYVEPNLLQQASIAAAQAIVIAAGGIVMTKDGAPVLYGNPDRKLLAAPPFVAGAYEEALIPYYLKGLVV